MTPIPINVSVGREWKTIDSAPKGKNVLVIDVNASDPVPFIASFMVDELWSDEPAWLIGGSVFWTRRHGQSTRFLQNLPNVLGEVASPTHWMELPDPPTVSPSFSVGRE